jgi:hypothetical protein
MNPARAYGGLIVCAESDMALPARRARGRLSTALSGCAAAVVAAGAALLSFSGMARATPINFVLSDVTTVFGTTTYSFSGSFTFDLSTLAETNINVSASPTNVTNPVIVSSYIANGALCAGIPTSNETCFTDAADDAALFFEFLTPLDGTTDTYQLIVIGATMAPGSSEFIFTEGTGSAVVAAVPEPSSLVLFVTALGPWFFYGRWKDRRHSA